MTQNILKSPLVISILFHSMVILSIPFLYSPARKAMLDVTPIEILKVKEENQVVQPFEDKKQEPKKIVKTLPPKQEQKREEIKKEPEKVLEEQAAVPVSEPPQQIISEAKTAAIDTDPAETVDSKHEAANKDNADEIALFKTMIRSKIEKAKFYPRWARQRGFEGIVGVQFVIKPDGNVMGVKVVRPCHCDTLNKAACEAIMKAAPFNPRPKDIENKEMPMEIDIGFRLE